jgi:hypothetical protein
VALKVNLLPFFKLSKPRLLKPKVILIVLRLKLILQMGLAFGYFNGFWWFFCFKNSGFVFNESKTIKQPNEFYKTFFILNFIFTGLHPSECRSKEY